VRKISASGNITTVAGTGAAGFGGDGSAATHAQLNAPRGLALDGGGNLYIADSNNSRIRKVNTSGIITTVAGTEIGTPVGLAVSSSGNLYISDISQEVVRKVATSGTITTVAGNGSYGYSGDGGAATSAELNGPYGVAVDGSGNLYIADSYNYRIRKVNTSGIITTVAGDGECCYGGDGGAATSAQLCYPSGVALDAGGDLYIADTCNNRIRKVVPGGTITTIGGTGRFGYSGDGNLAIAAALSYPYGLSVDAASKVAVVDWHNNAVRVLTPAGSQPVLTIQSAHTGAFAQGQTGATYTVTVSNGPGAGPTNGTVAVTEILPAGLGLVTLAGSGWTCSAPAAPTCTRSDALSGGSSYPEITVTVNVSATATAQLTNEATVSGGGGNIALTEDLTIVSGVATVKE